MIFGVLKAVGLLLAMGAILTGILLTAIMGAALGRAKH